MKLLKILALMTGLLVTSLGFASSQEEKPAAGSSKAEEPEARVESTAASSSIRCYESKDGQFGILRTTGSRRQPTLYQGDSGSVSGDEIYKLHFPLDHTMTAPIKERIKALMIRFSDVTKSMKYYDPMWSKLIQTEIKLAEIWGTLHGVDKKPCEASEEESLIAKLYEQASEILKTQAMSLRSRDCQYLEDLLGKKQILTEEISDLSACYLPGMRRLAGGYAEGTVYLNEDATTQRILLFCHELESITCTSPRLVRPGLSSVRLPGFTRISLRKAYLESCDAGEKRFSYVSTSSYSTYKRDCLLRLEKQLRSSKIYQSICLEVYGSIIKEAQALLQSTEETLTSEAPDQSVLKDLQSPLTRVHHILKSFIDLACVPKTKEIQCQLFRSKLETALILTGQALSKK